MPTGAKTASVTKRGTKKMSQTSQTTRKVKQVTVRTETDINATIVGTSTTQPPTGTSILKQHSRVTYQIRTNVSNNKSSSD